jgi:hypothetical protein
MFYGFKSKCTIGIYRECKNLTEATTLIAISTLSKNSNYLSFSFSIR